MSKINFNKKYIDSWSEILQINSVYYVDHSVKSVWFEIIVVRIFPFRTEYGEIWSISLYSVRMRENADQNNSECGHFSRSKSCAV